MIGTCVNPGIPWRPTDGEGHDRISFLLEVVKEGPQAGIGTANRIFGRWVFPAGRTYKIALSFALERIAG